MIVIPPKYYKKSPKLPKNMKKKENEYVYKLSSYYSSVIIMTWLFCGADMQLSILVYLKKKCEKYIMNNNIVSLN